MWVHAHTDIDTGMHKCTHTCIEAHIHMHIQGMENKY